MKKLWFLNSLLLLSIGLSLPSCKAKKAIEVEAEAATPERETIEREEVDPRVYQDKVIHQPGTIDQDMLDSVKEMRMNEKLRYKK